MALITNIWVVIEMYYIHWITFFLYLHCQVYIYLCNILEKYIFIAIHALIKDLNQIVLIYPFLIK